MAFAFSPPGASLEETSTDEPSKCVNEFFLVRGSARLTSGTAAAGGGGGGGGGKRRLHPPTRQSRGCWGSCRQAHRRAGLSCHHRHHHQPSLAILSCREKTFPWNEVVPLLPWQPWGFYKGLGQVPQEQMPPLDFLLGHLAFPWRSKEGSRLKTQREEGGVLPNMLGATLVRRPQASIRDDKSVRMAPKISFGPPLCKGLGFRPAGRKRPPGTPFLPQPPHCLFPAGFGPSRCFSPLVGGSRRDASGRNVSLSQIPLGWVRDVRGLVVDDQLPTEDGAAPRRGRPSGRGTTAEWARAPSFPACCKAELNLAHNL